MIRLKAVFYSLMVIVSLILFALPFIIPSEYEYIDTCGLKPSHIGNFSGMICSIYMVIGVVSVITELIHKIKQQLDEP